MAARFAHLSDVHLGAFREKELRELNIVAFEKAVDYCISREADFVVIAGDFFDIALPEMGVVDRAVRKMGEAIARGMRFYLVYGSHDYSPTGTSIIDVLCSAGVLVNVSSNSAGNGVRAAGGAEGTAGGKGRAGAEGVASGWSGVGEAGGGKIRLQVFKDGKTGVSLAGVNARARSLEEADFRNLDGAALESIPNPKIFVFHSAVSEYTPVELKGFGGGVPVSALPKGFDYYASGHVHLPQVIHDPTLGGKPLVYPGPLFASDYRDLEALAGVKHGFWFCEMDGEACKVERVELDVCSVACLKYDAGGKNPAVAQQDLLALLDSADLGGKIVLMKVSGALESGSPKEMDFTAIRAKAAARGSRVFYLNRNALEAREQVELVSSLSDARKIEDELFSKSLENLAGVSTGLKGASGLEASKALFGVLKTEQVAGEAKADFESRMAAGAKSVFDAAQKG